MLNSFLPTDFHIPFRFIYRSSLHFYHEHYFSTSSFSRIFFSLETLYLIKRIIIAVMTFIISELKRCAVLGIYFFSGRERVTFIFGHTQTLTNDMTLSCAFQTIGEWKTFFCMDRFHGNRSHNHSNSRCERGEKRSMKAKNE